MFFKAKENVSPHDFKYVRNPYEFCTDVDQVDLLVMIASASWQFDRRKIIRETWATQTGNGKDGFKVFCQIFINWNYLGKNFGIHERLWNICSLLGMMVSQIIIGSWIKNSKNMEILLKKISKKIIIIWHWRRLGNSNGRHITVQIWNMDFILMMMYLVRQRVIHTLTRDHRSKMGQDKQ